MTLVKINSCKGFIVSLNDGTPEILTVPSVYVVNWLRVYKEFSIPSFVPILFRPLVRSTSIITPRIFLDSHLPRSTSGTQNFTVSQTFPCKIFPLASFLILNACVSKLLFAVLLFPIILFLRLTQIDGKRATSVTISVGGRYSASFSFYGFFPRDIVSL